MNLTGKPNFPHNYSLYVSGTIPITLEPNIYNMIIQTDNNTLIINLPNSAEMMDSGNISFSAMGTFIITPALGDTIEGQANLSLTGSCLLTVSKIRNNWYTFFNGSGSGSGPLPYTSQTIYVNMGGSDSGTGTISSPYLTITHAMSTILDAVWEKRYIIILGPGNYSDNFSWKAWVYIFGYSNGASRLTGTIDINDPSWAIPGSHSDERSGAENLTFAGTINLNFNLAPSPYGKFYFWNCNVNSALNIEGNSPVNQVYIFGGQYFGGVVWYGANITLSSPIYFAGPISCSSSTTAAVLTATGGVLLGNLSLSTTQNSITAGLYDFPVTGTINISGSGTVLSATNSSLPILNNITVSGGAVLTRLTDSFGLNYVPTTPSKWNGNPTSLQNALDRITNLLYTLNANLPIP